jgi:hypothetical protein
MSIVLSPSNDTFEAVWEALERAGFVLRNWEDRQIIVYANKK